MTATTLTRDARQNVVLFRAGDSGFKPTFRFEKRVFSGATEEADVLIVEDLPVFRSGTFRDSMGYQHSWEAMHIDQMVSHFDLLRSRHIIDDVPVRKGHPGFLSNTMDELIGYHTALKSEIRTNPVDGVEYTYLLATFEVSDPVGITKISSGLWRNVSAEVGGWTSNNETEFWPVYQGVAYVDFSAVEGLKNFASHNGVGSQFSIMLDGDDKEALVGDEDKNKTVTPPAPQVDAAYHSRASFTFSIGGKPTNDFSAVQAHINTVEAQNATFSAAAAEAKVTNRKDFIKNLASPTAPKILASQIEGIEAYALKLDDESWDAFAKAHEAAPVLSSVSNHTQAPGGQVNPAGTTPVGGQPSTEPTELDTQVEIFMHNKRSGMSTPKLQGLRSYARLRAAQATATGDLANKINSALEGIPA